MAWLSPRGGGALRVGDETEGVALDEATGGEVLRLDADGDGGAAAVAPPDRHGPVVAPLEILPLDERASGVVEAGMSVIAPDKATVPGDAGTGGAGPTTSVTAGLGGTAFRGERSQPASSASAVPASIAAPRVVRLMSLPSSEILARLYAPAAAEGLNAVARP